MEVLLKIFQKKVIGIEPCSNVEKTQKKWVLILMQIIGIRKLQKIFKINGKVDLIYSANTISHIQNLDEVFKAINIILNQNGILIIEDPSLLDCLKKIRMINFIMSTYMFSH